MSGFNTFLKKEDLSLRLRAQNLKQAKDHTKRLEEDNLKMEERLRELKTAMNREKEDRERKGGGFWSKGQTATGSLTKYAAEVLQSKAEKTPKDVKKKKIKVLKDEPLEVPKRSSQPGTIKNIAQRKLPTGTTPRGDKLKTGPKCGQCEDRTATLTCVQCSEIFCFGCFSAFHLKGALKQHRSVPLSATGTRVCMSPRTGPEAHGNVSDSHASGIIPSYSLTSYSESGAAQANPSSPGDSSLLQGNYDESQSAASFQQALMAWRQGEQPYKPLIVSPRKNLSSPQKTLVRTLDESTGTVDQPRVPEIKFKSTLSYAERLMLKKHRRTELAEMSTPRLGGPEADDQSRLQGNLALGSASHSQFSSSFTAKSFPFGGGEPNWRQESFIEDADHVDFQSLFEVVKSSVTPDHQQSLEYIQSSDSTDQKDVMKRSKVKSSNYVVQEVSPLESWKLENMKSVTSANNTSVMVAVDSNQLGKPADTAEMFDRPLSLVSGVSFRTKDSQSNTKKPFKSTSLISNLDQTKDSNNVNLTLPAQGDSSVKPSPRSQSRQSKSRQSKAGNKSRAASRAESRALSRQSMKGNITKCPNDALKQVSQMTSLPQYFYHSPMEDFFLAGVVSGEGNKKAEKNKRGDDPRSSSRVEKVSNRLYQMAPRSWRPDSSLGETIPINEVKIDDRSEAMTLGYTYSGQISGRATEWRPSSGSMRVSTLSSANNVNVFGDELFTEEASQTAVVTPTPPSTPKTNVGMQRSNRRVNLEAGLKKSSANSFQKTSVSRDSAELSGRASSGSSASSKTLEAQRSKSNLSKSLITTLTETPKSAGKKSSISVSKEPLKKPGIKPESRRNNLTSSLSTDMSQLSQKLDKADKNIHITMKGMTVSDSVMSSIELTSSNSDVSQRRSLKSSNKATKQVKNVSNKSESEHRPLSSTNVPQSSQVSSNRSHVRPNSSSGPVEPLRKTQPSDNYENTVIADMMMSRVQEDGWIVNQIDSDSDTDIENSVDMDYDDGDDLNLTLKRLQTPRLKKSKISEDKNQHWETDVRPFSGVSIISKDANSPSFNKDSNKKTASSRPVSSRPASMLSGRQSKAIIMDGDDLSVYDDVGLVAQQDFEDKQALDQLEWELASDTGRLTADGKISRLSLKELNEENEMSSRFNQKLLKSNNDQDYDLTTKLCEDEKNAEKEVDVLLTQRSLTLDEDEVRALR